MKWFLLAFQLFNSHRSLVQSRAFFEKAKDAGEKSKKIAFFSFTVLLGLVYFIAGTIIAAVSLGSQYDTGDGIQWNGMMWAASGIILFGFFIVSIGALVLKFPADEEEEEKEESKKVATRQSPQDFEAAIKQLLLTFVAQMVKNLTEHLPKPEQRPAQKTQSQDNE